MFNLFQYFFQNFRIQTCWSTLNCMSSQTSLWISTLVVQIQFFLQNHNHVLNCSELFLHKIGILVVHLFGFVRKLARTLTVVFDNFYFHPFFLITLTIFIFGRTISYDNGKFYGRWHHLWYFCWFWKKEPRRSLVTKRPLN